MPKSAVVWSVLTGVIIGLGINHWSREKAVHARFRAPLLLSPDIPAASARVGTVTIRDVVPTASYTARTDAGATAVAANAHAVYVLRGDTLRQLQPGSLSARKTVTLPVKDGH